MDPTTYRAGDSVNHAVEIVATRVLPDPDNPPAEAAEATLDQVLTAADVPRSGAKRRAGVLGRTGRDGMHGEPLSRMLAEMQSVARAHPRGQW